MFGTWGYTIVLLAFLLAAAVLIVRQSARDGGGAFRSVATELSAMPAVSCSPTRSHACVKVAHRWEVTHGER